MIFSILSIRLLLDYLETKKTAKIILSSFCFFLALLSKESAMTLLAVIPIILFTFKNIPLKKSISTIIPLAAMTLIYFMIRASVLGGIANTKDTVMLDNVLVSAPDFISRIATCLYVLGRYL